MTTYSLKFINNLIEEEELTNILLYSEDSSGKTQLAYYIVKVYHEKIKERNKIVNQLDLKKKDLFIYKSLSLDSISNIISDIEKFIHDRKIIENVKNIIIIDDLYFINKIITNNLLRLLNTYKTSNIIFVLITKDISNIHYLIQTRCLKLQVKPLELTKDLLIRNYPYFDQSIIDYILIKLKDKDYNVFYIKSFIQYLFKYREVKEINTDKIKSYLLDDNDFIISRKLIDICIDETEKIHDISELIKETKKIYNNKYNIGKIFNYMMFDIINLEIDEWKKIIILEELFKMYYVFLKYSFSYLQFTSCLLKIKIKIKKY